MTDDSGNVYDLPRPPRRRKQLTTVADGLADSNRDDAGALTKKPSQFTEGWEEQFLAGFSRIQKLRAKTDPEYAVAAAVAQEVVKDMLEHKLLQSVFEPAQRPIYQRGELVGFEPVNNDKLLLKALETYMPERFHLPTRTELTGAGGAPIKFSFNMGDGATIDGEEIEEAEFDEPA